jgi:prenyltransferase beta subunit
MSTALYHHLFQTYEGGLGGEPGNEAHGGYTFCGLAAMALIARERELDLPALVRWAVQVSCGMMSSLYTKNYVCQLNHTHAQ